jgi:ankyrin repeat protein
MPLTAGVLLRAVLPPINAVDLQSRVIGLFVVFLLFGMVRFGLEPPARSAISGEEFTQAMATKRTSLIEYYFKEHLDPNARGAHDRPLMVAAALQDDWSLVRRLLDAGASADLADETGMTPLMVAAKRGNLAMIQELVGRVTNLAARDRDGRTALQYAIATQDLQTVNLLLLLSPDLRLTYGNCRDLLAAAVDTGNRKIAQAVLDRLPRLQEWSPSAQRALAASLRNGDRDFIRLLLAKHAVPATPEGRNVPLLAYAVVRDDAPLFKMLLDCGADPNTAISGKYDKDFLEALPSKTFRNYIEDDKNVTVMMLAAGIGRPEYLRALLEAGADRNRATVRYKMIALYYAAQTGNWRCTQILLGSGPPPEQLRIEITLASQHVELIKDGAPVFNTNCSTGRPGFATRRGDYVITDKDRNHWSTIYKCEMPYFMRLSCLDFGMHEGVVPNYPASHGCIRLPGGAARRFFAEIPIGTLVSVK